MNDYTDRWDRESLKRWEDDGGAPAPDTEQHESKENEPTISPLAVMMIVLVVVGAHVLPFSGALGCPHFAVNGCKSITVVFSFLAAFMLTVRVLFQDSAQIPKVIPQIHVRHVWMVEAIGALTVLVWLAPFYAMVHGMAEASIAALGIAISLLGSTVVRKHTSWMTLGHDLASALVILFAFAWSQTVPHFNGSPHGEDFLGAVAIGSSSLHSLRTVIEALDKCCTRWRHRR